MCGGHLSDSGAISFQCVLILEDGQAGLKVQSNCVQTCITLPCTNCFPHSVRAMQLSMGLRHVPDLLRCPKPALRPCCLVSLPPEPPVRMCLCSVVQEAVKADSLQKLAQGLEPMLRRIVRASATKHCPIVFYVTEEGQSARSRGTHKHACIFNCSFKQCLHNPLGDSRESPANVTFAGGGHALTSAVLRCTCTAASVGPSRKP